MKFKHFNHYHVPRYWKTFFTKYPEGHTILETMIEITSLVNDLADNANDLNDYVEEEISSMWVKIEEIEMELHEKVEQYRQEMLDLINEYQDWVEDITDLLPHYMYEEYEEWSA